MRSRFFLVSLIAGTALHAQWTANTAVNTSVRSGAGIDAATPLMANGPDGSTYVSWFDNQPTGYQLRMQRLDAEGYPMWDPAGLLVSDHPQNSALFRYDLITDGLNNAVVAFQDERSGQLDIVVYKISPTGDFLWGADGIQLTDVGATQGLAPVIRSLTGNNIVIAWNANDGGSNKWIPYQLLDANGTAQWVSPHQINGAANYSRPQVLRTLDGFLLQYVEETGNFPFTSNLYAERFLLDGTAVWSQATHISTKTISVFHFPKPIPDGNNGLYMAFTTSNPDNAALSDVYAQRVRANGSLWSATGTEVLTGTSTQRFGGLINLMNSIMGLLVPVQVTNTAQSQAGWNVQGLDSNGVAQLGASGVEVVAMSTSLATPDAVTNMGDGCIVVYSEGGFGQERIKATRLLYSGIQTWGGPVDVCTANSNKDDVSSGRVSNSGQLVAVWQDDRVGSGIYAQSIMEDGQVGPMNVAANEQALGSIVLQGPDAALLRVNDAQGEAGLWLLDMSGRGVWQQDLGTRNGLVEVPLPNRLPAGAYAVRYADARGVRVVRWVVP